MDRRRPTNTPHATSYGLDWPFTRKPREKKPAASSRRRSHALRTCPHRTQLLLGLLQRRQRQKEASSNTFREALQAFDAMGAALWANRTRAELARAKVPRSRDVVGLTPSEQRVAELAAFGMTNRDVAAALFISPKTVETNLARIYRKLGIKSRAELGRTIGGL